MLRLESSIISVPTYLAKVYLEGSHQCGPHFGDFDATDESLVYLAVIFMHPNPFSVSVEYLIMVDRVLFRLLQFLKRMGQCLGDEVKFVFFDDQDPTQNNYDYNQYSAATLTDAQLLDLLGGANDPHLDIIRDFVTKRNFCLHIVSEGLDPLVLSGPILKIFGKQIKDNQMTIDDDGTFVQFNFF